jgi:hypothetical protein
VFNPRKTDRLDKLPLAFASTINFGFGFRWDLWLCFSSFQNIYVFWNGASLSTRGQRSVLKTESESYVTPNGQSASLSWNKAPIWGLRPDFYYSRTVAGLLMWGALSDERTGLSFTIAAGSSQWSHSQVWVPWDSRPYFTVSDLRLHF